MRKNVLAKSIAAAVAGLGLVSGAYAITVADISGTATDLRLSTSGTGHSLFVPYFTTQSGNSTLLSLVNTDTTNGKAVKVRFRGASNSDDIFDFQVFLSPGDVWTANISANSDGLSYLTTADNTCTKPSKATLNSTPFITSRLNPLATTAAKAAGTREGYVEIFNMADIPPAAALFPAIKHVAGVAPCGSATGTALTAWTSLDTNASLATYTGATIGLANPTTGLLANYTYINVPKALSWTGEAQAVEAVDATPALATGNIVYFPQSAAPVPVAAAVGFTADPLLATGIVVAGMYDLPDMSTPYAGGVGVTPSAQAINLTAAIAATSVINEFVTEPGIFAETDWVFSMPTRRYAAAVKYAPPISIVQNPLNITYFDVATNLTLTGDQICVTGLSTLPAGDGATLNQEEGSLASSEEVVISPGLPAAPLTFCGEDSVLSFNSGLSESDPTLVLGATVAKKAIDLPYTNGWMKIATPGATPGVGLPVIGKSFISAFNPSVSAGTAGNFGMGWAHRYTRP
ncbi:cell surface protein [Ramlibacter sp. H39-3-26]|uniref:cell surface protein n=1 Tax=Curvibacter soli TaxID=3031331 RepID=UPI0023DC4CCF|nr:cell surface protein [Ramlibacter sp. H39-3-26]MDF1486400.1 cell surface protein [Ramlibacter sp. H39-3-26]